MPTGTIALSSTVPRPGFFGALGPGMAVKFAGPAGGLTALGGAGAGGGREDAEVRGKAARRGVPSAATAIGEKLLNLAPMLPLALAFVPPSPCDFPIALSRSARALPKLALANVGVGRSGSSSSSSRGGAGVAPRLRLRFRASVFPPARPGSYAMIPSRRAPSTSATAPLATRLLVSAPRSANILPGSAVMTRVASVIACRWAGWPCCFRYSAGWTSAAGSGGSGGGGSAESRESAAIEGALVENVVTAGRTGDIRGAWKGRDESLAVGEPGCESAEMERASESGRSSTRLCGVPSRGGVDVEPGEGDGAIPNALNMPRPLRTTPDINFAVAVPEAVIDTFPDATEMTSASSGSSCSDAMDTGRPNQPPRKDLLAPVLSLRMLWLELPGVKLEARLREREASERLRGEGGMSRGGVGWRAGCSRAGGVHTSCIASERDLGIVYSGVRFECSNETEDLRWESWDEA